MKPKLLILIDWFDPAYKAGGPIRSILNLVPLIRDDFEIIILTSDQDVDNGGSLDVTPNVWIKHPSGAMVKYLSKDEMGYISIIRELESSGADIIYLNSQYSVPFTIYPLLRNIKNNIADKVVLAPRGMLQKAALSIKKRRKRFFNRFFRELLIKPNMIFQATDEQESKDIVQRLKISSKRVITLSNVPSPVPDFKPAPSPRRPLNLLFSSRLSIKKNLHTLLMALGEVKCAYHLTVIGEFEERTYKNQCERIIEANNLQNKVTFLGALRQKQILGAIMDSHVFILPSFGENFSHSIYEALSAGRPVIIGEETKWKDIDGKAGRIVHASSVPSIISAIDEFGFMPDHVFQKYCHSAREIAFKQFEFDYRSAYKQLFVS